MSKRQEHLASVCEITQISRKIQISWKFELTAFQGHPRSSILVVMKSVYATSY